MLTTYVVISGGPRRHADRRSFDSQVHVAIRKICDTNITAIVGRRALPCTMLPGGLSCALFSPHSHLVRGAVAGDAGGDLAELVEHI